MIILTVSGTVISISLIFMINKTTEAKDSYTLYEIKMDNNVSILEFNKNYITIEQHDDNYIVISKDEEEKYNSSFINF